MQSGADGTETSDGGLRHGLLKPGGNFVVKLLEGAGITEYTSQLRKCFAKVKHVRPEATRQNSREVYLIGLKRLGAWSES